MYQNSKKKKEVPAEKQKLIDLLTDKNSVFIAYLEEPRVIEAWLYHFGRSQLLNSFKKLRQSLHPEKIQAFKQTEDLIDHCKCELEESTASITCTATALSEINELWLACSREEGLFAAAERNFPEVKKWLESIGETKTATNIETAFQQIDFIHGHQGKAQVSSEIFSAESFLLLDAKWRITQFLHHELLAYRFKYGFANFLTLLVSRNKLLDFLQKNKLAIDAKTLEKCLEDKAFLTSLRLRFLDSKAAYSSRAKQIDYSKGKMDEFIENVQQQIALSKSTEESVNKVLQDEFKKGLKIRYTDQKIAALRGVFLRIVKHDAVHLQTLELQHYIAQSEQGDFYVLEQQAKRLTKIDQTQLQKYIDLIKQSNTKEEFEEKTKLTALTTSRLTAPKLVKGKLRNAALNIHLNTMGLMFDEQFKTENKQQKLKEVVTQGAVNISLQLAIAANHPLSISNSASMEDLASAGGASTRDTTGQVKIDVISGLPVLMKYRTSLNNFKVGLAHIMQQEDIKKADEYLGENFAKVTALSSKKWNVELIQLKEESRSYQQQKNVLEDVGKQLQAMWEMIKGFRSQDTEKKIQEVFPQVLQAKIQNFLDKKNDVLTVEFLNQWFQKTKDYCAQLKAFHEASNPNWFSRLLALIGIGNRDYIQFMDNLKSYLNETLQPLVTQLEESELNKKFRKIVQANSAQAFEQRVNSVDIKLKHKEAQLKEIKANQSNNDAASINIGGIFPSCLKMI